MNTFQASATNSQRDYLVLSLPSANVKIGDAVDYKRKDGAVTRMTVTAVVPGADKGSTLVACHKASKPTAQTKATLEAENIALRSNLADLAAKVEALLAAGVPVKK